MKKYWNAERYALRTTARSGSVSMAALPVQAALLLHPAKFDYSHSSLTLPFPALLTRESVRNISFTSRFPPYGTPKIVYLVYHNSRLISVTVWAPLKCDGSPDDDMRTEATHYSRFYVVRVYGISPSVCVL